MRAEGLTLEAEGLVVQVVPVQVVPVLMAVEERIGAVPRAVESAVVLLVVPASVAEGNNKGPVQAEGLIPCFPSCYDYYRDSKWHACAQGIRS